MAGGAIAFVRKRRPRVRPRIIVEIHSPNHYSEQNRPLIIVVHSTEGPNQNGKADLVSLGEFFAHGTREGSTQVGIDDDGNSGRFVRDEDGAYACVSFNNVSLNIEEVGFAAQKRWSRRELKEAARWIAQWSHEYQIPIRRGHVHGDSVVSKGVVTHKQLGYAGGSHSDPGDGYPVKRVMRWAKVYKALRYGGHRRKHHHKRR